MKNKRIYFENGKVRHDKVTYIMPDMPPEFKELADTFFLEMQKLVGRIKNGETSKQK